MEVVGRTRKLMVTLAAMVTYSLFALAFRPEVSLESSDGRWGNYECRLKGIGYERLVLEFEQHRESAVGDVTLFRTTPMKMYSIFAWPSYLLEAKWRLPYRKPSPSIDGGIYLGRSVTRQDESEDATRIDARD